MEIDQGARSTIREQFHALFPKFQFNGTKVWAINGIPLQLLIKVEYFLNQSGLYAFTISHEDVKHVKLIVFYFGCLN
jgi:hypothetical protein